MARAHGSAVTLPITYAIVGASKSVYDREMGLHTIGCCPYGVIIVLVVATRCVLAGIVVPSRRSRLPRRSPFSLGRISIPSVTVAKLMIKEPPRNPIWTVRISWRCQAPIKPQMRVPGIGYLLHRSVLCFLHEVAPVVWRLALTVCLQVFHVVRQPMIDMVDLSLADRQISVSNFH